MFVKEPSNSLWAIELKEINKVVGWVEIHKPIDNIYVDVKEIGFVLSELYWGQGMAKEVIEKCGFKYQLEYNDKLYYSLEKILNCDCEL